MILISQNFYCILQEVVVLNIDRHAPFPMQIGVNVLCVTPPQPIVETRREPLATAAHPAAAAAVWSGRMRVHYELLFKPMKRQQWLVLLVLT